jgi:hypothetical protein
MLYTLPTRISRIWLLEVLWHTSYMRWRIWQHYPTPRLQRAISILAFGLSCHTYAFTCALFFTIGAIVVDHFTHKKQYASFLGFCGWMPVLLLWGLILWSLFNIGREKRLSDEFYNILEEIAIEEYFDREFQTMEEGRARNVQAEPVAFIDEREEEIMFMEEQRMRRATENHHVEEQ